MTEQNWAVIIIVDHFSEKVWKKCKFTKIMHSESIQTTLVEEDWDKYGTTKIGHSDPFWTNLLGKDEKKCKRITMGHSK